MIALLQHASEGLCLRARPAVLLMPYQKPLLSASAIKLVCGICVNSSCLPIGAFESYSGGSTFRLSCLTQRLELLPWALLFSSQECSPVMASISIAWSKLTNVQSS